MAEKEKIQTGTTNTVTKITPQTVPADYAALGVQSGYNPLPADKLRMFIVGPSGEGKTTFISSSPRTLVLDHEVGADGIPGSRAHRLSITTPEKLEQIVVKLEADGKKANRPYDRIVFDTIDQMVEMMNPHLAKIQSAKRGQWEGDDITSFGDRGGGWAILKSGCWSYIQRVEKAGYTWTCVGHITEKNIRVNNQDRTVPRPVLFDSFTRLIGRNCAVFAAIYSQVELEPTYRILQGRQVKGADKEVVRVYMDATTISSEKNTGQGKLRGVPTMTTKILLPDSLGGKHGWDTFKAEYDAATAKVRKQLESPVGDK